MSSSAPQSDSGSPNPVLVEVTRGDLVESRHRAAVAVVDAAGSVLMSAGNIGHPVYPRSAIKQLQALALVESGAAEAFGCSDAEITLACASHNGEPRHVEVAQAWLKRLGLSETDLECGAHAPKDTTAAEALLRAGESPTTLHNNCSGKHVGYLATALHLGAPTRGYIRIEHPVQQRILGILEMMSGCELRNAPRGIDGCGIPQIAIPLSHVALAFAQFADPVDQPERRQAACERICSAMAAHPFLVAGSNRFCTRVMEATQGRVLVKTGAEGVFSIILPEMGIGVALKIDDGATRAAEVAAGRVLEKLNLIDDDARAALSDLLVQPVKNVVGRQVGQVRVAQDSPF
ncbi:asparaginase [Fodinicurvata halophila]|uniref:Asparaginase n=1 Tax=Fodinicurvata halophila TaxID=1419723 RepID=A0ABV8UJ99_9PROT